MKNQRRNCRAVLGFQGGGDYAAHEVGGERRGRRWSWILVLQQVPRHIFVSHCTCLVAFTHISSLLYQIYPPHLLPPNNDTQSYYCLYLVQIISMISSQSCFQFNMLMQDFSYFILPFFRFIYRYQMYYKQNHIF